MVEIDVCGWNRNKCICDIYFPYSPPYLANICTFYILHYLCMFHTPFSVQVSTQLLDLCPIQLPDEDHEKG